VARLEISLAQWSLHRAIQSGALSPLDFPRIARRDFGIAAIELVSTLLPGARPPHVDRLRRIAEGEGVRTLLIMVDDEGDLGHPKPLVRRRAVRRHFPWVDAVHRLGGRAIRVNTGGQRRLPGHAWRLAASDPCLRGEIARLAESLAELAAYAAPAGVSILLENHGGLSSSVPATLEALGTCGAPNAGTLPDFGNFPRGADPYEAVRQLLPRARAVSAKSFDFGADGLETTIDYPRMLGLVRESGYEGHIGIEYEGSCLAEHVGIQLTRDLLEKLITS
jgi:sugar phosphate isomerase/epimerase